MPSRRTIALILFFWLLTTGYVAYRDLWPRLFAYGPPPVTIDLADEATQTSIPIRWTIYRGDQKVGSLVSSLQYVKANDTFEFKSEYKQLVLEVSSFKCVLPEVVTIDRITRGGDLREQTLEGKLEVSTVIGKLVSATAKIHGTVINGQLVAECQFTTPFGDFKQTLDPVPVPTGQPLNPLLPVNRLANIEPGLRWHVRMNSPLEEAVDRVVRKQFEKNGFKLGEEKSGTLHAEVKSEAQDLNWFAEILPCWVIEYRQDEPVARTWVRVADGRVMKQEAFFKGERLTILRDR